MLEQVFIHHHSEPERVGTEIFDVMHKDQEFVAFGRFCVDFSSCACRLLTKT